MKSNVIQYFFLADIGLISDIDVESGQSNQILVNIERWGRGSLILTNMEINEYLPKINK